MVKDKGSENCWLSAIITWGIVPEASEVKWDQQTFDLGGILRRLESAICTLHKVQSADADASCVVYAKCFYVRSKNVMTSLCQSSFLQCPSGCFHLEEEAGVCALKYWDHHLVKIRKFCHENKTSHMALSYRSRALFDAHLLRALFHSLRLLFRLLCVHLMIAPVWTVICCNVKQSVNAVFKEHFFQR